MKICDSYLIQGPQYQWFGDIAHLSFDSQKHYNNNIDYRSELGLQQTALPFHTMKQNLTIIADPPNYPQPSTLDPRSHNERMFQKWLLKNNLTTDTPLRIQKSFQNLQDPRTFKRDNNNLIKLQNISTKIKQNMIYERQTIAEMSKSTYKKVVSRDKVDYQFGSAGLTGNYHQRSAYHQLQKRQDKKKQDNNRQLLQKRQELTNYFIHNYHQADLEHKHQVKELTLDIIKQIDTKDFQQKYHNVQYFDVFVKNDYEKFPSAYTDISENYDMDQILNKIKFAIIDRDSYYSPKSKQLLFQAEDQLDFWRRYTNETQDVDISSDQVQIMKRCHNFNPKQPSFQHLLEFASGKLDADVLSSYFRLKNRQEAELKINYNDQNLQEEYKKKKEQYDFLRQMKMNAKTQRIAVKYTKNQAQTIDNLQDQSFDSYFQQTAKNLFIKVQELNQIRDTVMQKKQPQETKKVMLMNIGYEIKDLLFKILALTLTGQSFVNYQQIMASSQQGQAEKKMLQIIYHQFHRVQHLKVDGIPKTSILDFYLEQRQKNQKMFQLLGRVYVQEKPTSQHARIKSKINQQKIDNGKQGNQKKVNNKIPTTTTTVKKR